MNAPIDDGGAAFPDEDSGMTLRQWYAGQALPGVIVASQTTPELTPEMVANECVLYADAMIAALEKENS